ncbi:hypothetical protein KPL78_06795 [Roseomonas sp. HJA6]|uniref:Uncharacterized protein n=1 Tax=Roseomonas alba TaxID=2846776 RepID=A0ABS7A5G2_9PROT|nr:hypothetical protein [Neoroseomonas alba]MBW6397546.1 hypothetical protein [Neoroseomonas alba]
MIDNFIILVTCGAVALVAIRAIMFERRGEAAQRPQAAPAARSKRR